MANQNLFASLFGKLTRAATTRNEAGGKAYVRSQEQALAQFAVTGCLNGTFYASAEDQLTAILALAQETDPRFLAQLALYSREKAAMKDTAALLCAVLTVRGPGLLHEIWDRVIDNARMLRTFVQILRSGVVGRKSLGSLPKRLVLRWLESRDEETLFRASVGNAPSLADIVKMVHPKPATARRRAFYGWLLGREHDASLLPEVVRELAEFRAGTRRSPPDVPFEMLTALPLGSAEWTAIAQNARWHQTRMNLNTFLRHGVFDAPGMAFRIAARLANRDEVRRSRVFPYQLMIAYLNADAALPPIVRSALENALEASLENVPTLAGKVVVCLDVSGSMHSPVTGHRKGATTKVRCVDVAALVAAALVRANPSTRVLPFSDHVVPVQLDPQAKVLANAQILAGLPSGGTNCSAPLQLLVEEQAEADLVIFVSDNQSWVDANAGRHTATFLAWTRVLERNPRAKLACIDVQPSATTQAPDTDAIMNLGGFSDAVFTMLDEFARGEARGERWVRKIQEVAI